MNGMIFLWLSALLLNSAFIKALRLHSELVTALQLSMKLGEHTYEAGTILMSAIDTENCFDSFSHLLSVETMSFRKYYQDACGSVNVSAKKFINTVWKQCQHRGIDVGKLVGIECLANIYKFGMHMESNSHFWNFQCDSQLTSEVRLDNFSLDQVRALVKQVAEPVDEINPLTTAYLCPEIENYGSEIMNETRILDGPFMDSCPRLGPVLVRKIPTVNGIDLSRPEKLSVHERAKLASHLSSKFGILDVVGKYLQLGALGVFACPTSPVYRNRSQLISAPMMKSIKAALCDLNRTIKSMDPKLSSENLILSIARELSSTMINTSSHAFDLHRLLKSLGTTEIFEFYTHIMNFLEGIFDCEAQINIQNMLKIVQVRVDALILLSQYSPDPERLEQAIAELLADDKPDEMPFFRVPCRSLLTLLWSISKENRHNYTRCCHLLMNHIVENMSPGSDHGILKWLQVDMYLPWYWKAYIMRYQAMRSTSEFDFYNAADHAYLDKLIRFRTLELQEVNEVNFKNGNGYMDIDGHRKAIMRLIATILEHHYIYVGHDKDSGRPAYIQSLTCHPFIHDLLIRLIRNVNALRVCLPFQLHPLMSTLMMNPGNSAMSTFYVRTVLFTEFYTQRDSDAVTRNKLIATNSLIDHLLRVRLSKKQRTLEAQYLSWMNKYHRHSKSTKTVQQLEEELQKRLTPEIISRLTSMTFQHLDINQYAGVAVYQAEGISLLFNHSPVCQRF